MRRTFGVLPLDTVMRTQQWFMSVRTGVVGSAHVHEELYGGRENKQLWSLAVAARAARVTIRWGGIGKHGKFCWGAMRDWCSWSLYIHQSSAQYPTLLHAYGKRVGIEDFPRTSRQPPTR